MVTRLEQIQHERIALNGSAPAATAETWLKIAELHDEEARIWHAVWTGPTTEPLLCRAAIVAEQRAMDDARFWRDQAKRGVT